MMSRLRKGPVKAFSIGFRSRLSTNWSMRRSRPKFQADHHTYLVGPEDCFEALPRHGPAFRRAVREFLRDPDILLRPPGGRARVKALLAGDGGDELFGGNERYRTDKIFATLSERPAVLRKGLIEPVLARAARSRRLGAQGARLCPPLQHARHSSGCCRFSFCVTHPPREVFDSGFLETLGRLFGSRRPCRRYYRRSARARSPGPRALCRREDYAG